MKTTDYIGPAGVPLTGNAVLLNALSGQEGGKARSRRITAEQVFPVHFLAGSLFVTAATIAWNSYQLIHSASAKTELSIIGPILLLLCLVSWGVTTRSLLRYQRETAKPVHDVADFEHLRQQCELMRTILDNLPDHIYAKDRQGRFVLNNMGHARSLGLESPEGMVGKSDFDYFPKDLATQFFADEQALIGSGQPIINQEQFNPVPSKPGENYWASATKVLWRDRQNNIIGTAGITRDIHATKMAQDSLRRSEEKLRQSTIQLERSNRELQDFAYVASHDLQEPLRKIVVFGERLKEKCADSFSIEGRDYLERMRKAASRMQILINDLLSFSRVTTKAQPFVPVNLSRTAQEVVGDLEARVEQVDGRVELGALPLIEAEPLQMRQLLQNLIGNALKFRRPEEPPVVKVDAKIISALRPRSAPGAPPEELCILTVSDNCIGFEEKYLDRIFNVFQRLHTRNEYEGTGMGLAIARKIALYHGGEITAKSKPGHGSTFIVTLPVAHPKAQNE